MKAIGIIPARYASTRFPGKPLAMINGKSLIQRTYENAKLIKELNEIVIATDDERIFNHAKEFGAEVVMTSPECPTGTDRIREALKKEERFHEAEFIVNIQGDEPCLNPIVVSKLLECLIKDSEAVAATPICRIVNEEDAMSSSVVKCVKNQYGDALYFSRTLIPAGPKKGYKPNIVYFRHIGIYAYRREFLETFASLQPTPLQMAEDLEQLKILEWGYKIKVAEVEASAAIEVNHPEDIQKVEHYLCKQNLSS